MNKIEFIKLEFEKYYKDISTTWEGNVVHDNLLYHGRRTHCRSCMYTLCTMLKPKYILEIGSMHYDSSNMMARAMDELNIDGFINSIDIMVGGYDALKSVYLNKKVKPHFWIPHHTSYDTWKYSQNIVHPEFKIMKDEDIFIENVNYLKGISPVGGYDLIMIDGDHSYEGISYDWKYTQLFSHDETVIVIDDMYDSRHWQVRKFFDELITTKWDFREWNNNITNPLQSTGITMRW